MVCVLCLSHGRYSAAVREEQWTQLSVQWDRTWRVPAVAHELKERFPQLWVRFHSLPGSKRYADTPAEYEALLDRHTEVLRWLEHEYGAKQLVVFVGWHGTTPPDPAWLDSHGLRLRHWRSWTLPDSLVERIDCYASEVDSTSGLVPLLLAVADEERTGVIIAPVNLQWLYHPYDGGADIVTDTTSRRDILRALHPEWLSSHPSGY